MLSLDINDNHEIQRLIVELRATEDHTRKALYSTFSRMGKWVRTQAVRGLSDKVNIQQKILRQRVLQFRMGGSLSHALTDRSVKVWFGLNPIPWSSLNARATKRGGVTAAGGRHDPHAFIAKYGNKKQVLKRVGKSREPLQVIKSDIAADGLKYIEHELLASIEFEAQFMKFFERELRWRTSTRH